MAKVKKEMMLTGRALVEKGAAMLGLSAKIDEGYAIPMVDRRFVLWMKFKDRSGGKDIVTPYVLNAGLVDVLHQRGWQEINCESLPPRKCHEMGHENMRDADRYCQRAACTITLKTGQKVRMEADSCLCNTKGVATTALSRMAETRAMGRAIRRACNVSAVALIELADWDKAQEIRVGDKIIDSGGLREVIDADFKVEPDGSGTEGVLAAITKVGKAKVHQVSPEEQERWNKANRELHKALSDTDVDSDGFHEWVKRVYASKGMTFSSLSEMPADELEKVFKTFWEVSPEKLGEIKAWCALWKKNHGKKG